MTKTSWWLVCGAVWLAGLTGCATSPTPSPVARPAATATELSTLDKLVRDAGLAESLSASGPYTLFAPSDAAFKSLPAGTLEAMAKDKEQLRALVSNHVVAGKLTAAQIRNGKLKTLQGAEVVVSKAGEFVTVEEALVTRADLPATNGVVHVIDRVLLPPKKK